MINIQDHLPNKGVRRLDHKIGLRGIGPIINRLDLRLDLSEITSLFLVSMGNQGSQKKTRQQDSKE